MTSKKRTRAVFEEQEATPDRAMGVALCQLYDWQGDQLQEYLSLCKPHQYRAQQWPNKIVQPKQRKSRNFESLWDVVETEAREDKNHPIQPIEFQYGLVYPLQQHLMSRLQIRLIVEGPTAKLDERLSKYFRAISVLEYEHDNGSMTDIDFRNTSIGDSIWTATEKKKFFIALERCGRNNPDEIARRVGPTKTVVEVYHYLHVLESVSKGIGRNKNVKPLTAREMSPVFIMQENDLASKLQQTLENESYAKHRILADQDILQPTLETLDVWNLSSLTRLFAGTNDMTLLSSAAYNLYQLLTFFIQDIMKDLHTQSLLSGNTITKSTMNMIIAKRSKTDSRLKHMDIMAAIDKRYRFHGRFSVQKSASFLAKRRRMKYDTDPPMFDDTDDEEQVEGMEEFVIPDENNQEIAQDSDEEKEDDEMIQGLDEGDELWGRFITVDEQKEQEDAIKDYLNSTEAQKDVDSDIEQSDDEDYEEEQEEKEKALDREHEQNWVDYLGIFSREAVRELVDQKYKYHCK